MPWPNLFTVNLIWITATAVFAGFEYLLPEMTRPGVMFAVSVAPGLRADPAGASIIRRYRRTIMLFALAALLMLLAQPIGARSGAGAFLAQYAGFLIATLRARRETKPHAIAAPTARQASPEPHEPPAALAVLAIAPVITVIAAAIWIPSHWDRLRDPFPVHWMLDGEPDAWVARTPFHVYGMLGLLGGIIALLAIVSCGLLFWSRRIARPGRPPATGVGFTWVSIVLLVVGEYLLAAAALMPLGFGSIRSEFAIFVVVAACSIYLAIAGHSGAAIADGARAIHDGTPDEAWKLGIFYFNRHDPAFFVEKRFGLGWSLNFGHRLAWLAIAAALLPMAVGVAFLVSAQS